MDPVFETGGHHQNRYLLKPAIMIYCGILLLLSVLLYPRKMKAENGRGLPILHSMCLLINTQILMAFTGKL